MKTVSAEEDGWFRAPRAGICEPFSVAQQPPAASIRVDLVASLFRLRAGIGACPSHSCRRVDGPSPRDCVTSNRFYLVIGAAERTQIVRDRVARCGGLDSMNEPISTADLIRLHWTSIPGEAHHES